MRTKLQGLDWKFSMRIRNSCVIAGQQLRYRYNKNRHYYSVTSRSAETIIDFILQLSTFSTVYRGLLDDPAVDIGFSKRCQKICNRKISKVPGQRVSIVGCSMCNIWPFPRVCRIRLRQLRLFQAWRHASQEPEEHTFMLKCHPFWRSRYAQCCSHPCLEIGQSF